MDDFEFDFFDRVQKIRSMNELYHLEAKSFVSFSGGKDSTVLSELIDIALPNNKIPRVYIDTGIDYKTLKNENHGAIITTALHHLNHEINLL